MIDIEKLKAIKEEVHRERETLQENNGKLVLRKTDEILAVLSMVHCLANLEASIDLLLGQIEKVGGQIVFVGEEIHHD